MDLIQYLVAGDVNLDQIVILYFRGSFVSRVLLGTRLLVLDFILIDLWRVVVRKTRIYKYSGL